MNRLKTFWHSFRSSVRGFDSPHQLALGCAFGMMIGLIPMESLFVYAIGIVAIFSTANLLCLVMSALVFHWISGMLDHWWHELGSYVLTLSSFEATWASLYEIPVVAWTCFNNTVVAGSLLGSLVLFIPFYIVCRVFCARFGQELHTRYSNSRLTHWLMGPTSQTIQET